MLHTTWPTCLVWDKQQALSLQFLGALILPRVYAALFRYTSLRPIYLKPLVFPQDIKIAILPGHQLSPEKSKPTYSGLLLWQFKAVHSKLSYLRQHFPFPSSNRFKDFLDIKLHSLRQQCTSLKKPTIHIRIMQRAHHDSFLLSPYSQKAVLHLWTAWWNWTVPECLLWVTKLTTASLLDFHWEQSSIYPVHFPRPTQHHFPILSLQAVGTLSSAPFSLPGTPSARATSSPQHHGLLRRQKGVRWTPICSESPYHWCVQVKKRPLFLLSLL